MLLPTELWSHSDVGRSICCAHLFPERNDEWKKCFVKCSLEMNWRLESINFIIYLYLSFAYIFFTYHLPIFQITDCSLKPKTKSSVYHKRLITSYNIKNFRSHLCSINWGFSKSSSSNALYNSFIDCLYPIYETCLSLSKKIQKPNLGLSAQG